MTGMRAVEDGWQIVCEEHGLDRYVDDDQKARNLFAEHVREDHNVEALTMPAHDFEGSACKGASVPGYVHLQHDGQWHCNACGTVTPPGDAAPLPDRPLMPGEAARFLLLIRESETLAESTQVAVLGLWEQLTGLYGDEALTYARELAARPGTVYAHIPTL